MSHVYLDITSEKQKEFIKKILFQAGHTCADQADGAEITLSQEDLNFPLRASILLNKISSHQMRVSCGPLTLDRRHRQLSLQECTVHLTEKETEAMKYFMHAHPKAVHRDDVLRHVWGYNPDVIETHTLETLIYRLRQKLQTMNGITIAVDDGYYSLKIEETD